MGYPNRGKEFEQKIKEAIEVIPDTSIDRLPDPTNGYMGVRNVCDFMVYKKPYQYYLECKCTHENTMHFSHIRDNQWHGLSKKAKIEGVVAGLIIWFILRDRTVFIPISRLEWLKDHDFKSVAWDLDYDDVFEIKGRKQRIFYEYDMIDFFEEVKP